MFSLTTPIRHAKQNTRREMFDLLFYLGYFDFAVPVRNEVEQIELWERVQGDSAEAKELWHDAVCEYQRFCGLVVDGEFGNETKAILEKRFCAVPDKVHPSEARGSGRKWPQDRLTFHIVDDSGVRVPYDVVEKSVEHTIVNWNAVCGVLLETWESGEPGPNIYGYHRRIDSSGRTLAWSMLAYRGMPSSSQLEQRYDNSESWYYSAEPSNQRGINLAAVTMHEVGHALGMEHIPFNFARALMNPIYDPEVVKPLQADVDVVREYFGDPLPPEPGPVPTPGRANVVVKFADGVTVPAGGSVTIDGEVE